MSVQYDAANAPFTYKQAQEQYEGAVSVKPSQSVLFGVECKPGQVVLDSLYIRNSSLPANTAIQFCDMGILQVSTNGLQGSSVNLGELWVSYEVELIHEKLSLGEDQGYNHSTLATITSGFATFVSTPISGVVTTFGASTINLSNFSPGIYLVNITMFGATLVGTGYAVAYTGNCSGQFILGGSINEAYQTVFGNTQANITIAVNITNFGAGLNLSGITWTGTVSTATVLITPLPNFAG